MTPNLIVILFLSLALAVAVLVIRDERRQLRASRTVLGRAFRRQTFRQDDAPPVSASHPDTDNPPPRTGDAGHAPDVAPGQ
jgi:hypothetical protein